MDSERLRKWAAAFKEENKELLLDLQTKLRARFLRLDPADQGNNGKEILKLDILDWFMNSAFTQFPKIFPHSEREHHDGGAACALLVLTLWGARDLALMPGDTLPEGKGGDPSEQLPGEEILRQSAGGVYLTNLVPVLHQVRYPAPLLQGLRRGEDTLLHNDLGEVGVHVVFRTPLWGAAHSQSKTQLPKPLVAWEHYAVCFRAWQDEHSGSLRLPSLARVQAQSLGA